MSATTIKLSEKSINQISAVLKALDTMPKFQIDTQEIEKNIKGLQKTMGQIGEALYAYHIKFQPTLQLISNVLILLNQKCVKMPQETPITKTTFVPDSIYPELEKLRKSTIEMIPQVSIPTDGFLPMLQPFKSNVTFEKVISIIGVALMLFGAYQNIQSSEQAERHHREKMQQDERQHKESLETGTSINVQINIR